MIGLKTLSERFSMTMDDRIESLKGKHASLDATLQSEVTRPLPDDNLIHDLKRQKLRIKDEIVRLSAVR
jgi:hypothetical protein